MKPVFEFLSACLLVFVAGCSAIAGIFNAGVWAAIIVLISISALILLFLVRAKK
jgi:hypothetical protein